MKLCEETVTVFNARVDPETGGRAYRPTVIAGASWYETQAEKADAQGGLVSADRVIIRIPADADAGGKRWAEPVEYRAAASADGLWTLNGGDVIVKGAVAGDGWTPARLRAEYPGCATVVGVADNRRAPRAPHWRVIGR